MSRIIIYKRFIGLFLMGSISFCARASEGKPARHISIASVEILKALADTIPPAPVKPVEAEATKPVTEKPAAAVIKEVPKARRVSVPKPVTIKAAPVKIIKPKIIKPIIKI